MGYPLSYLYVLFAVSALVLAAAGGCGRRPVDDGAPEVTSPWASPGEHYGAKRVPGTPVIRVREIRTLNFDGVPDEADWKSATAYTRFGLARGTGLLQFPTSLRLLRTGRVLWLALDCTIPPDKTGAVPDDAIGRELIEVWIDKGPTNHTFYQIMFEPKDAKVVTSWAPEEKLAKGFQVKTKVARDGYTAEVRIDLDALDDFGAPPGENVGFNLARSCGGGWGSLVGVVGHVHKPNQFWLLDLAGTETEVAPTAAWRDPFKPDADTRKIADTLVNAWTTAAHKAEGKPWARMQAMMDSLAWKITRDDAWPWGAKHELAALSWRALVGWREMADTFPIPEPVRALEAQLAEYPDGPYPKTRWREDAYVSDFDHTAQPYAIFLPEQYDGKTRFPLVLFLHGSGTTHFGEGAVFERYWDDRTPYIKVRPKARYCGWYGPLAVRDVMDVIDDVCRHHAVDEDRIYLVGYSAGGFAAPVIAAEHPERFAGIVAIAGGMGRSRLDNMNNLPVLVVHGYNDPVVWFNANQGMSALRLRDVGAPVVSAVFPATGHGVATAGYADQLLVHRRRRVPDSVSCLTDDENPAPARCYWVSLLTLISADHQAGVRADVVDVGGGYDVRVQTANVAACALDVGDVAKEKGARPRRLTVDGQTLDVPDGDFCRLTRTGFQWKAEGAAERPEPDPTHYRAGGLVNLFREGALLIVAPEDLTAFAEKFKRKRLHGMRPFSSVPVRKDTEVTDDELKTHHLVLLGGPKLNRVSKRLAAMQSDWPLPGPQPDGKYKARGEDGKPVDVAPTDGFVFYDAELEGEKVVDLDGHVVATVTFNPMNRGMRVWAVFCNAPEAFNEKSAVIERGSRRERQADVMVIDVKAGKLVEERTLTPEFKPRRYPMRGE